MLGKLIKYDFRSCIRRFGPLWLGLTALAAINGFTIGHVLDNSAISGWPQFALGIVPMILLGVMWTAVAIMTLVFVCERFYKGLLGDEGYLSLTLPVTTEQHILSKAVVATLLEIITGFVAVLSGCLLVLVYKPSIYGELFRALPEVMKYVEGRFVLLFLEYLLFILAGSITQTMHIYLAICLGHLARNHRVAWSVGAYILINVVMSNLLALLMPFMDKIPEEWFFYVDELGSHIGNFGAIAGVLGGVIVVTLLVAAAFFCGADYILKNKLNLE